MHTYSFAIVVEPDEDRWRAYCPALHERSVATWGHTREEALRNIDDVVHLVIESIAERGGPLPEPSGDQSGLAVDPRVAVTV